MFDTLIYDAQTFVRARARDNTRDWFQTHKSDYDTKLRDPAKGYAIWDPKLKRVPPPFDKNHQHSALLRHKGLVATGHPDMAGDLVTKLTAAYADIWPLSDMLIGVAETPTI